MDPKPASPTPPKRGRRIALLLVVVAVLLGGARYGYWTLVERRWLTITEDLVYKSGTLTPDRLVSRVEKYGIRTVIDLRREPEEVLASERDALTKVGVRYVNVPTGQVPPDEAVEDYLELMDDSSIYPVLVHCEHGAGRGVLFSALYRIEIEGWSPQEALEATAAVRSFGAFADDERKGQYLNAYVPRRERAGPVQAAGSEPGEADGH